MQLDLFPGYTLTSPEVKVEIQNEVVEVPAAPTVAEENNQFEVLLYANNDNARRDLEIRVNSPEGNIVFSHINPEQQINVYIDGDTVVKGNLSITGDLLMNGKITYIGSEHDNVITYIIGELEIKYDVVKNLIYLDNRETKNYAEIGKMLVNSLRKYQDRLTFNDCKDFFNY